MTPEELAEIEARQLDWDSTERMSLKVWEQAVLNSAADVPALTGEVRRLRAVMEQAYLLAGVHDMLGIAALLRKEVRP